jgi:hypothetical protein
MCKLAAVALLACLAGAGVATVAVPAAASRPTSVLVVAPDIGRAAALHVTHPSYQLLADLVQYAPAKLTDAGASRDAHVSGRPIRLTWLVDDVRIWRIDIVYFDEGSGGPWIATQQSWDRDPREVATIWHRSSRPGRLAQLLGDLTLLDPSAPMRRPDAADMPAGGDGDAAGRSGVPSAPADRLLLSGWRWMLPGALAGGVLAYIAVRLRRSPDEHRPLP